MKKKLLEILRDALFVIMLLAMGAAGIYGNYWIYTKAKEVYQKVDYIYESTLIRNYVEFSKQSKEESY